jgi:serine phosphatase RsbU (regulator of sigma subunit)
LIQRLLPNTFLRREIAKSGVRIRPAQGYPLGVVSDGRYENVSFTMAAGDRLTLYTDGLLEARNAARELFGFDRVRNLIATSPDADAASDAAVAFGQDDDITVLTVTRVAGTESAALTVANEIVSSPA